MEASLGEDLPTSSLRQRSHDPSKTPSSHTHTHTDGTLITLSTPETELALQYIPQESRRHWGRGLPQGQAMPEARLPCWCPGCPYQGKERDSQRLQDPAVFPS